MNKIINKFYEVLDMSHERKAIDNYQKKKKEEAIVDESEKDEDSLI